MAVDSNSFQPMPSDLPADLADAFVHRMGSEGVALKFDEESLVDQFDEILEAHRELIRSETVDADGVGYDLETAAVCYFGEVVRQTYDGQWLGEIESSAGVNFYRARLQFGDYRFEPFCWIGYRLANGREEGTVASCLAAVTPSMKDGIDHKKKRHDKIIEDGGVVFDKEVY